MKPIRNCEPDPPDSSVEPTASTFSQIQRILDTSEQHGSTNVIIGRSPAAETYADLTADERAEAEAALRFLGSVRRSLKDSSPVDHGSAIGSSVPTSSTSQAIPISERIGNYRIIRSIGRGGFAEVFLARNEVLDRLVALKGPLIFSIRDDQFRIRFEREARAAAMLSHPQIVPVYEFGCVGMVAFIAYAWIDGCDLATWLLQPSDSAIVQVENEAEGKPGKRQLELREIAEMISALAQAIQNAHQRGLIHRDLKPSNVLVASDPDACHLPIHQRLRITDFGLVLSYEDSQTLTTDGSVIGTPAYMSPEQAAGQRQITYAADVWALGVMLYELLVGCTPFERHSKQATLDAIRFDEPAPIRRRGRTVPKDLNAICLKCLNKLPEERYSTAGELADDLQAWLQNRPITARPISPWLKLNRWAKRNRVLAVSLPSILVTLLIATGMTTWKWKEAQRNLQLVQNEQTRVQQNLDLMSEMVDKMLDSWEANDWEDELTDSQKAALNEVLRIEEQILAENQSHVGLRQNLIRSHLRVAELSSALGEHEKALENCQQATRLLAAGKLRDQNATPDDLENWLKVQFLQAHSLLQTGKADRAQIRVSEIETRFEVERKLLSPSREVYFSIKLDFFRGQTLIQLNQPAEALIEFQKVADQLENGNADGLSDETQKLIARSLISQSYTEHRLTRYVDSYQTISRAIGLLDQLLATNPNRFAVAHHLANAHYLAASTLAIIHDWNRVEQHLIKAVAQLDQLMLDHGTRDGLSHSAIRAYCFLAQSQWNLGHRDQAFETSQKVDQIFQPPFDTLMNNQRVWVQSAVDRATWLRKTDRTEEADQLTDLAHARAVQWLTDFPNDIGAQQSLFAAHIARLDSVALAENDDQLDELLSQIMIQGDRLLALNPNRETRLWVGQSQNKAWRKMANQSAVNSDFETTLSAIETLAAIPQGNATLQRFNATIYFAQLLSRDGWYQELTAQQQDAATDYILDSLEQATKELNIVTEHLDLNCWNFLQDHPRFAALKTGVTDSPQR
ncbi:MAG TPA: serine/threonine-protein kinase [Pirellulaceae bacterium]|nr:serine/threonine-protein kinase [Pirellulaceae bacterium]